MKTIKTGEPLQEQRVITVEEPILSGWLTYKGDQRAGFAKRDGTEAIKGEPNPPREKGLVIDGLWDGRLWVAHEAEVIEVDDTRLMDEEPRRVIVATRVRFRQVWTRDEQAVIQWDPNYSVKIANADDVAAPTLAEMDAGTEIGHLFTDVRFGRE